MFFFQPVPAEEDSEPEMPPVIFKEHTIPSLIPTKSYELLPNPNTEPVTPPK